MSTTVNYKGSQLVQFDNDTKVLKTQGKYLEDDITIQDVSSSVTVEALNATQNGTYNEEGKAYKPVTVNVAGGNANVQPEPYNQTNTVQINNNTADIAYYIPMRLRLFPNSEAINGDDPQAVGVNSQTSCRMNTIQTGPKTTIEFTVITTATTAAISNINAAVTSFTEKAVSVSGLYKVFVIVISDVTQLNPTGTNFGTITLT